LRHGTYWAVGYLSSGGFAIFEHNAADGSLLTTVEHGVEEYWRKPVLTADRKFVVVTGSSGAGTGLITIDTTTKQKVDTGPVITSDVTICDDGTIVSGFGPPASLVTQTIDDTGHLTTLAAVDAAIVIVVACSPGSDFVIAAIEDFAEVRSFALRPSLTQTIVDTLTLPTAFDVVSLAFNPATSDLYLLQENGKLSVSAFDSNTGMFGALQTSVDIGGTAGSTEAMQFAYGKLFVVASDQLLVYDSALNLLSSEAIISDASIAICISEGVMCC
jgi:hypothetical protein